MQQPRTSARTLNPEAGEHAISADPGEQAAAEAATRLSWREFPYYAKRYGERGWRFSLSDSGWLQTPDRASRYDFLRVLSAHLRELREASLPAAAFASLASEFEPEWIQAVQAVIDQARAALTTPAGSASVR